MKRSKFNKIIDEAITLQTEYMDKINEILLDEKLIKKGGYQIELLGNHYAEAGRKITDLQSLKRDLNGENVAIENLFGLNSADMFDEEDEEK